MRQFFLGTIALSLFACGPHTTIHETSAGGGIAPIASGQDVTAPPPESDAPAPHAWLWRVSGGDAATYSYVLGTLHAGIHLATALPPAYETHLSSARTIVLDVDLRGLQQALATSAQTRTRGARTLDRLLGRESWARLTTELTTQLQPDVLRAVSPSAMTIYMQQVRIAEVEASAEGRDPITGAASSDELDASILDEGSRRGASILPLETPAQGLAALDTLPAADVLAALHRVIDQPEEARQQASAVRTAYLGFDEAALVRAFAAQWTPEQRQVVLTQRNQTWEATLLPQIQQGNAFVAIGIDHLVGEGGVLESLRAHGYTVERLGQ